MRCLQYFTAIFFNSIYFYKIISFICYLLPLLTIISSIVKIFLPFQIFYCFMLQIRFGISYLHFYRDIWCNMNINLLHIDLNVCLNHDFAKLIWIDYHFVVNGQIVVNQKINDNSFSTNKWEAIWWNSFFW